MPEHGIVNHCGQTIFRFKLQSGPLSRIHQQFLGKLIKTANFQFFCPAELYISAEVEASVGFP